mmetsp:Transcript_2502/g.5009  ORF Transcript_2502/g.5009 Transcript_2502/m.5009 type:complete len:254 (+) Transcript_2502:81-842(+)
MGNWFKAPKSDRMKEGDATPAEEDGAAPSGGPGPSAAGLERARAEDLGVSPYEAWELPPVAGAAEDAHPALVVLSQGSVVGFRGDVIVNAANAGCLIGGGVDGAIADAGGEALADARLELPVLDARQTRCPTGDAKRTIGGDLRCKWVAHAVGPNYNMLQGLGTPLEEGDRLLRSAYLAAMKRSEEVSAETVGFALLSAGIFRGPRPLKDVLEIGVSAVREGAYPGLRAVHFVAFTQQEVEGLSDAAKRVFTS